MTRLQLWIAERSPLEYMLIFVALIAVGVFALSTAYGSDSIRELLSYADDEDEEEEAPPPLAARVPLTVVATGAPAPTLEPDPEGTEAEEE